MNTTWTLTVNISQILKLELLDLILLCLQDLILITSNCVATALIFGRFVGF